MANARDVWIIHMPLQGVPPRERLHATSNHQSLPKHIRSSIDVLLLGHPLLDARVVQVCPVHVNSAARPLARLYPTIVSHDVPLEVGNTPILLCVFAPNDRALEVGFLVDQHGTIVALEVTRGVATPVRMRTPMNAGRRNTLLGFGRGRTCWRELLAAGRLGLRGDPAPLLLLTGSDRRTVLFIVMGGRNVVDISFTVKLGAIVARGRGGCGGRGRGSDACVIRSRGSLRRVINVIEVGCIARHCRRVDGCGGQVGNGEDLGDGGDRLVAGGRWGELVDRDRRY